MADDKIARDLLDVALQNPVGINQYAEVFDNVQTHDAPTGNSADAALRRLRKDRPDLHERVLSGELTPHAAMVLAGFRSRTVSVPVDDVDSIARTLRKNLNSDQIEELVNRLTGDQP